MLCEVVVGLVWRLRVIGREHVPPTGPVLFVSNHQSYLDPIINGIAVRDRQLTAIARESLFRFRPFAWLMYSIGAIAIREDSGDSGALKAAISELAAGRCILIYPEGSRTETGRIEEFKKGFLLLVRKAKVPVLPMAVEGAFDVWPRGKSRPMLGGRLGVKVCPAIPYDVLMADGPDAALAMLRSAIEAAQAELRAEMLHRSGGRWPKPLTNAT